MSLGPSVAYFGYEAILALATYLAARVALGSGSGRRAEFVLVWLLLNLIADATLALVLTLAHLNHAAAYFAGAALLLGAAYVGGGRLSLSRVATWTYRRERGQTTAALLAVILFTPIVVANIRPVEEIDSLRYINDLLAWAQNAGTPFDHFGTARDTVTTYTATWELTYLPGFVIGDSASFIWFTSMKAIAAVGVAHFAVARRLRIPLAAAVMLMAGGLLLKHFWLDPTGLSTMKNDMAFAAGFLTLAVATARVISGRLDRTAAVLLSLGVVFVTVKFSGIALAAGALVLLLALAWRQIVQARLRVLLWALATGLLTFVTTGVYYARNALQYGNPFHPIQLHVGELMIFNGPWNLEPTTILANLGDPAAWQALARWWYVLGPAFPLVFVVAGVVVVVAGIDLIRRRGRLSRMAFAMAVLSLLGFLVYARTYWSAGTGADDVFYLSQRLASTRYVIGPLLLAEVVAVVALIRLGLSATWLGALLGLNAGWRLLLLLENDAASYGQHGFDAFGLPLPVAASGVALAAACLAGLWALGRLRLERAWHLAALSLLAALLVLSPAAVELNRQRWMSFYRPAWEPLLTAAPTTIALVSDDGGWDLELLVVGLRLQHEVLILESATDLGAHPEVRFAVRLQNPNLPDETLNLNFAQSAARFGYSPVHVDQYVAVSEIQP